MALSTNANQNASSRLLFSVQISTSHCHNLNKSFFKFIPACLLNSLQILLSFALNFCRNFAMQRCLLKIAIHLRRRQKQATVSIAASRRNVAVNAVTTTAKSFPAPVVDVVAVTSLTDSVPPPSPLSSPTNDD